MTAARQPKLRLALGVALLSVALVSVQVVGVDARASEPVRVSPSGQLVAGVAPVAQPAQTGTPVITTDLTNATISRYGRLTSTTFKVVASGENLKYRWQYRSGKKWHTIKGATAAKYKAKATRWGNGTRFRVIVTGTGGKVTSSAAKLTVLYPTKTPAADAESAFGLSGLSQGVDLSAYQWTPWAKVKLAAVKSWAGKDGFALLRTGSGSRPIRQAYTDVCTNKVRRTGAVPVTRDCAYPTLAKRADAAGLRLGHYWFNGWIAATDSTSQQLFAGGYTPTASARQYVAWLKADGRYTRDSTDPLVLDIEPGNAWIKTHNGQKIKQTLRAWTPAEAVEFLTEVKELLTADGYHANLYVYMSQNRALQQAGDAWAWQEVAGIARLWVAFWGSNNARIPDFQPQVGPWTDLGGWSIWQYTSNGRLPGDGVPVVDADIAKPDAWTPR